MSYESQYAVLVEAWRQLDGGRRQAGQTVTGWRASYGQMEDEQRRLRSDGRWRRGHADLFGVLNISRAEIRHSAMIAWLLDPIARHGLGTRFIDGVLKHTFGDESFDQVDSARPRCEHPVSGGRVDIVVTAKTFTLVIENKVDSPEGEGQCDSYYAALKDMPNPFFILLKPGHDEPTSASGEAKRAFRVLQYADVRTILANALKNAELADGRRVAEDYLRTLNREFS